MYKGLLQLTLCEEDYYIYLYPVRESVPLWQGVLPLYLSYECVYSISSLGKGVLILSLASGRV